MTVEAHIEGVQALQLRLRRLGAPLNDVAAKVRVVLHAQHERRVATEKTDPDGSPWPELAPSTLARKRGSMLVETARLLGSFTTTQSGLVVEESNQADPYNFYINFGTRNMPARRYMGIGKEGRDEIMQACVSMIARRMR